MPQGRRVCSWPWIPHVTTLHQKNHKSSFMSQYYVNKCWILVRLIGNAKNTFTSEKYSDPSHTPNLSLINYQLLASFIYTSSHFLSPPLSSSPSRITLRQILDILFWDDSLRVFFPHFFFFLINLSFWKHFRFAQNLRR